MHTVPHCLEYLLFTITTLPTLNKYSTDTYTVQYFFVMHRNNHFAIYFLLFLVFNLLYTCMYSMCTETVRGGGVIKVNFIINYYCSTVQYSTVQYSTVQYSTAQHRTEQNRTEQNRTVQYSTVQHSTVQYSSTVSKHKSYYYILLVLCQTSSFLLNLIYIICLYSTYYICKYKICCYCILNVAN